MKIFLPGLASRYGACVCLPKAEHRSDNYQALSLLGDGKLVEPVYYMHLNLCRRCAF